MCARVRYDHEWSETKIVIDFDDTAVAPNISPSWNIPPTGTVLTAIRSADGRRLPEKMRFGLIPKWAKDAKMAFSTFNARAETLTEKPVYRDPFRRGQRCLVVVNGFYEWRKAGVGDKHPFAIGMTDGRLMTLAGLWDEWRDKASGEIVRSCSIVTCVPNATMAALHDRMPVLLEERDWGKWLGEEPASQEELLALLKPCPDNLIVIWPVGKAVGNVRNDSPSLAEPVAAPE